MARTERTWIQPSRDAEPRSAGAIVAKDVVRSVESLAAVADTIVVSHHEGLANSPGGITVRARADFKIVRARTGVFGAVVPIGDRWLVEGPTWAGRSASVAVLDPATLETELLLPVCKPYVAIDDHRFVASTPAHGVEVVNGQLRPLDAFEVDPAIEKLLPLPRPGGLVVVDWKQRTATLLFEARPYDEFRFAAIDAAREVVYAATSYGWIVALRLADRAVLWQRPPVKLVTEWSVQSLALDPTGRYLACGGSGQPWDLLVLDTRDGNVETRVGLCALLDEARVASNPNTRIETLAFHPTGWLVIATNAGVVAELTSTGALSAFRGATRGIRALAFVDDGRTLIVGGAEPNLRVWPVDATSGT